MSQTEQEGRGVTPAKVIEGWMRPSDSGPGYELGKGAGWCEFNECGQPEHGDVPATLVIGEKAWPESKVRELSQQLEEAVIMVQELRSVVRQSSWAHVTAGGIGPCTCKGCTIEKTDAFLLRTKPTDPPPIPTT